MGSSLPCYHSSLKDPRRVVDFQLWISRTESPEPNADERPTEEAN
ncbi:hypothetical protein PRBEI_2001797200 [Prionailurus iriomotensis]